MGTAVQTPPGFFARVGLALKLLGDAGLAQQLTNLLRTGQSLAGQGAEPKQPAPPPEKVHASGLFVLSVLQQEGRLIDFLRQDVASFGDEEVGAAARVVHSGCRKALDRLASLSPVLKDEEGSTVTVAAGFDPNRIRLTGHVTGQPPFKGTLKHHGWAAGELKFPMLAPQMDYRVLAPAEVEL